jgi:hypothetical protein
MRFRVIGVAVLSGLAALVLGAPGDAYASKEKFVRSKPHVNASGPHRVANETMTVMVEVVDVQTLGGTQAATKPCAGEVDIRIENAGTGGTLASGTALALAPGAPQSVSYSLPSAAALTRAIIVARNMEVDGKECVLRGEIEFQSIATGQVCRRVPIRRVDFVAVK